MRKHWHIASGLAGYGPDGSDGLASAFDIEGVAELLRSELDTWADSESMSAACLAESGDYESAWKLEKHAQELETIRADLDNNRANAPLYTDNRALWHESLNTIIHQRFPLPVDEGRSQVYAWECTVPDCDQLEDYEPTETTWFDIHIWPATGRVTFINAAPYYQPGPIVTTATVQESDAINSREATILLACAIAQYANPPATHYTEHGADGTVTSVDVTNFNRTDVK